MKKIINDKVLVIPPYISTGWKNISALYQKGDALIVTMWDGGQVTIPDMKIEEMERIFSIHADYLEKDAPEPKKPEKEKLPFGSFSNSNLKDNPLNIAFGAFDNIGFQIQHNPELSNTPDLPPEIIKKITQIAKIVSPDDIHQMPKPETGCNCTYCQITKALHETFSPPQEEIAEDISDTDLNFQDWTIEQTGENLYTLTHRLDKQLQYSVYLGEPMGCTCGRAGCEHIVAVLKSP